MTLTRRSLMALAPAALALGAALPRLALAETTTDSTPAPAADSIVDFGVGDPNAKLTLSEYLSFTCPHCEHFHSTLYPKLKADYIDKGLLRLEYHEVYFDKFGLWGAMLARCGGEMRYAGIVDLLYDRQRDWAATDDPTVAVAELKKIGLIAGIDEATADACLKDQGVAQALVGHYKASLERDFPNDSFHGTPSFLLNGVVNSEINANMDYADLKAILDAELAK